jgi:Rab-GTPase-TBC domain
VILFQDYGLESVFHGDAFVTRCDRLFNRLLAQELPVLWEHFHASHIETALFFTPWLRSFFLCSSSDLRLAVRFLDVLLVFGVEAYFRVAIGILRLKQERLLAEREFIPLLHLLKDLSGIPVDHIMAAAHAMDAWSGLEQELEQPQLLRGAADAPRARSGADGQATGGEDQWCSIS